MRLHHLILVLVSHVVIGLPITSQPLASNPEHLTWDAWLMSSDTRHPDHKPKKITPKSIFITPNLHEPAHPICPPDHKLDTNNRCIQIVQINHDDLLAHRLDALLEQHGGIGGGGFGGGNGGGQGNEEYDYDYEEIDDGPFQLSLPLTFDDQKKDSTTTTTHDSPFHQQEIASHESEESTGATVKRHDTTTTESSTDPSTSSEGTQESIASIYTEDEGNNTTTTPTASSTIESIITTSESEPESEPESLLSSTTEQQGEFDSSPSSSSIDYDYNNNTTTTDDTITEFLASSSSENQASSTFNDDVSTENIYSSTISLNSNNNATENSIESTTTTASSLPSTSTTEQFTIDMVVSNEPEREPAAETNEENTHNIDINQATNQTGILLLEDKINFNNTGEMEFFDENGEEESFEDLITDLESDQLFMENNEPIMTSITTTTTTTMKPSTQVIPSSPVFIVTPEPSSVFTIPTHYHQKKNTNNNDYQAVHEHDAVASGDHEAIQTQIINKHEQTLDYIDNLDSNNRFVYHHLTTPKAVPTTPPPPSPKTTASYDVLAQIREINRIVSESGFRRPVEKNRIRFPTNEYPSSSNNRFSWPYDYWQSSTTTTTTPRPISPVWWLPDANWSINNDEQHHQSGQKPMLLRFWERMPLVRDPSIQHQQQTRDRTSSRSQRRENSRSPSEGLYKVEATSHDIYKVLQQNSNRDWKHTNS